MEKEGQDSGKISCRYSYFIISFEKYFFYITEYCHYRCYSSTYQLTKIPSSEPLSTLDSLLLCFQFHNDMGVFCALMLKYVFLEAGDAIFLAANKPHAYLSGGMMYKLIADSFQDSVECMAASDNVVRSGLTPKFKVSDGNLLIILLVPLLN